MSPYYVVVVSGLGTNLFSVTTVIQKGVTSLFYPTNLLLEKEGSAVLPMQDLGVDPTTGKRMCLIDVKLGHRVDNSLDLGVSTGGVVMQAATVDLWHRRMGHINRRSMDVLRKVPGNGVQYTGGMEACGACSLGKSAQQDHPKKATYDDVILAYKPVSVDTLGPINPQELGGYRYVTKFVDQRTKRKDIFHTRDKTYTIDSIALYNKAVVIIFIHRLVRLKVNKGTKFTSAEVRQYCLDIDTELDFTSPNTPQQIGANERAGRTLANMVRCFLADSGLPKFLWGEFMQSAVYLSNRTSHAALASELWLSTAKTLTSGTFGRSGQTRSCTWKPTSRRWSTVPGKDPL